MALSAGTIGDNTNNKSKLPFSRFKRSPYEYQQASSSWKKILTDLERKGSVLVEMRPTYTEPEKKYRVYENEPPPSNRASKKDAEIRVNVPGWRTGSGYFIDNIDGRKGVFSFKVVLRTDGTVKSVAPLMYKRQAGTDMKINYCLSKMRAWKLTPQMNVVSLEDSEGTIDVEFK